MSFTPQFDFNVFGFGPYGKYPLGASGLYLTPASACAFAQVIAHYNPTVFYAAPLVLGGEFSTPCKVPWLRFPSGFTCLADRNRVSPWINNPDWPAGATLFFDAELKADEAAFLASQQVSE